METQPIIIGELAHQPSDVRKKFWLEELKLPLQWHELSEQERQDPSPLMKTAPFDGILLDGGFSDLLLPQSTRIPSEVLEAGLADALIRENGKAWLHCFFREALRLLIVQNSPKLDTHATCYITGSNNMARACAAVASQLGFGQLVVISSNQEEAQGFAHNLQKLFFGLNILILGETELTLQPNNGTLLLNTITAETGAVILEDLTYLNFLKKDGLVVDVPLVFQANSLLQEAEHVGVHFISGIEIWGYRDFLFLSKVLKERMPLDLEAYLTQWKAFTTKENQT